MRNRLVSFLGMVLLLTGLLTGCDKSSAEAGAAADGAKKRAADEVIVTMPTTSEPESGFDPAYGWGAGEHVHEPLIQSTLTTTTKDLKIEKDLATDYQASPDGLTWTVTIRDDVAFTDGETLTAEDVAFTYNHCKEKSTVNDFTMLDKAVAVDDKTVEFHMTRAFSIWPYTMAVVGIIPEHAYDENYGQNPVGSGRYIMKQWDKGQQVIFEANPDYYGEKPKIKKVTVLFMEEDAALAAAMAGKVDVAHTAASYSDQQIEGYSLLAVQTVDNRGFNLPSIEPQEKDGITYGNAFTADVNVRRAINIGIDREEMIENVLNGYGTQAYSVCDKMPWYNSQCEVDYDQEEARRLLTEAGWVEGKDGIREKDGNKLAFHLMYFAGDSMRQAVAMSVANQAKENLGFDITVEGVSEDDTIKRMFSEPMIMGWGSDSPMTSYMLFHSSNAGKTDWYNPEFYMSDKTDEYLDKAMNSLTIEDSYEWWQKAQWDGETGTSMKGEAPWAFFVNMTHLYYVKDGLNIGNQRIHAHGQAWPLIANLAEWSWE